jgi:hypothetical protein
MEENYSKSRGSVFQNLQSEHEKHLRKEASQGYSDTIWNLGRVADILWRHAPSARALITLHVNQALESAMSFDSMPLPISDRVLLMDYWSSVIKPMLDSPNLDKFEMCRELSFLMYVTPLVGPEESEYVTDLFEDEIVSQIFDGGYWNVIVKNCPEISAQISRLLVRNCKIELPRW